MFLVHTLFTAVQCAIMYWIGKKYAVKEDVYLRGAILRSAGWSLVFCWTVLLVGGGVVPAIIPLPSWGAVLFWLIETDAILGIEAELGKGIRVHFVPHILLSPAIPIAAYLFAFRRHKNEIKIPN